ncbi:MAG: hypothetical protein GX100_09075 [candidate division WS1 bacterium]|jgi:uroporphyrinogen-III decarboxylase|nr:hypothetical protein [candidate division WS1 bacterium]
MSDHMTPRERWLAALRLQPVDRLPFWPKLGTAYLATHQRQPERTSLAALHREIGSDRHEGLPSGLREVRDKTSCEVCASPGQQVTRFCTPHGETALVNRWDAGSLSWHPVQFPVRTRRDLLLMTEFYADVRWELDPAVLEQAQVEKRRLGEQAVSHVGVGESPFMYWIEWLAGVEQAHFLLHDYPDEVEALLEVLHAGLLRCTELIAERHPADLVYFVENTSTSLLSPAQYRQYCQRHLSEYAALLGAHERLVVLHMCGLLRDLLPDLAELPVAGFEAFTSPPVGNTTLAQGRAVCPSTCLIGGTNAVLWTHPADRILMELEAHLDALPHTRGLVVTSAGVMPPLASPETLREVCTWVREYPVRN